MTQIATDWKHKKMKTIEFVKQISENNLVISRVFPLENDTNEGTSYMVEMKEERE
jgi:hypothetical protein